MKVTTDHAEIRQWLVDHGAVPAMVKREHDQPEGGALRIDFTPNVPDADIIDISWTAFFDRFEQQRLAFRYDEADTEGLNGALYEFIPRQGGG